MTTLATDSFPTNGANLGANWTVPTNGIALPVVGNRAEGAEVGSADPYLEYYSAVSWPVDQWAQVTIGPSVDGTADSGAGLALRIQAGGDLYFLQAGADSRVYSRVTNSYFQKGSTGPSVVAGDVLYFEVRGTAGSTVIIAKKNSTNICGSPITIAANFVDSGNAGIFIFPSAGSTDNLDDWSGGDFATAVQSLALLGVGS
jgi:hypothetical protein